MSILQKKLQNNSAKMLDTNRCYRQGSSTPIFVSSISSSTSRKGCRRRQASQGFLLFTILLGLPWPKPAKRKQFVYQSTKSFTSEVRRICLFCYRAHFQIQILIFHNQRCGLKKALPAYDVGRFQCCTLAPVSNLK